MKSWTTHYFKKVESTDLKEDKEGIDPNFSSAFSHVSSSILRKKSLN